MVESSGQRAFESIRWHMFLNTRSARKAEKLIDRVATTLGQEVETISIEPYWKIDHLTDVVLRTDLGVATPQEALFALVMTASRLSRNWMMFAPQQFAGQRWEFQLLANDGFTISGVDWANARTDNLGAEVAEGGGRVSMDEE